MMPTDPEDPKKKLKKAARKGVEVANNFSKMEDGKCSAACNMGTRAALESFTGSKELYPSWMGGEVGDLDGNEKEGQANDLADYLASEDASALWEEVKVGNVQDAANDGDFIVGVWKSEEGSGHVVVAVPGEAEASYGWEGEAAEKVKTMVPQVMDTGVNKRTESQGAGYSFGSKGDKRKDVKWYRRYVRPTKVLPEVSISGTYIGVQRAGFIIN